MHHLARILLVIAVVAAGCTTPSSETPELPVAEGARPASAAPAAPAAPSVDGRATTTERIWAVGDWWTWQISSDHESFEVTTVVAAADDSGYQVGVTDLEAGLRSLWFHLPMFGQVEGGTLAWEMHDLPVELIDLPLSDGKTWEGELEGDKVLLRASARGEAWAVTGTYENERTAVTYTWSPEARMFDRISLHFGADSPWATGTLVDHGSGHTGLVHLIDADDALLGRSSSPGVPTAPGRFEATASATHLVVGCRMGGTGAFSIRFVAPEGGSRIDCEHSSAQLAAPSTTVVHVEPVVPGQWLVLYSAAGRGGAFTEVSLARATEVNLA